ncbi:MAG: right-handed parallel beta-helix repeat-containing protein [Verrucomicrobia bacterium]|nr:right-handed parallel beta-helix repeat-containing protein [Verrucomicrobiota bacterium]
MKALLYLVGCTLAFGGEIIIRTPQELAAALRALPHAEPTRLRIAPGDYPGGHHVVGVMGLTVEALDPKNPPHFRGGANAWQFSQCRDLTVRHLRLSGQTGNGLNLDDGGKYGQPVTGVTLEDLEISDIGPQGNHDGIKCSGLKDLTIRRCTVSGWGGQGIDFVGCHAALITECRFVGKPGFSATAAIQLKGGTSDVVVTKCHFVQAGDRPLNLGGSTGLPYFRPPGAKHEAARLKVTGNTIEGSPCAAAFVGVDGAEFSHNTILFPTQWVFRILQETREPGFAPCRDVRITDNRIVFRRGDLKSDLNIGTGTEPQTFVFARNRWFAEDRPKASRPSLPTEEKDGQYGQDPR